MAWKMVRTLFPQYQVSARDRNVLLHLLTLIALEDLHEAGWLQWRRSPPPGLLLKFGKGVRTDSRAGTPYAITHPVDIDLLDKALERSEKILDSYGLDEGERATLYTALPCLGLAALEPWLKWKRPPPFAEL